MNKQELRKEIKQQISQMSVEKRAQDDKLMLQKLKSFLRQKSFPFNAPAMAYIPLPDEPDISPCFDWFSTLTLPQMLEDGQMCARTVHNWQTDCTRGRFDVLEPRSNLPLAPAENLKLVIVPGRAFTEKGLRLGRGKGYYDRFLAKCAPDCLKIALLYTCQLVPDLPHEKHDLLVDHIIVA